ncbi:unnamed protein product [Scytosiphon promiscuus]
MAQPSGVSRAVNVLIVGTTGSGKSTLANLLLYGEDAPATGFPVGDLGDSMTTQCKSATRPGPCDLQVTDTPGVPDTDRTKSLVNYDRIIEYLRGAPWLNAIIIMVAAGRTMEREYKEMRALMQQFNRLPCVKIMVCRVSILANLPEERRRRIDEGAEQLMNRLCAEAGLSYARKLILHNMNSGEVTRLRELVSVMHEVSVSDRPLRTFVEIEAVFKSLSVKDTRRKALENEREILRDQVELEKALVQNLANDLEEELSNNAFLDSALKGLRAALEDLVLPGSAVLALGGVETVVSKLFMKKAGQLELAKAAAEARIEQMAEEIKLKSEELRGEGVDQLQLEKAKEDYEELHKLSVDP